MGSTNRIGQAAWVQDEIHGPGRRCPRGALVHPLPSDVCTCTCTCSQADHTSSRDCTWCRGWRLGCCRRLHPRRPCLAPFHCCQERQNTFSKWLMKQRLSTSATSTTGMAKARSTCSSSETSCTPLV